MRCTYSREHDTCFQRQEQLFCEAPGPRCKALGPQLPLLPHSHLPSPKRNHSPSLFDYIFLVLLLVPSTPLLLTSAISPVTEVHSCPLLCSIPSRDHITLSLCILRVEGRASLIWGYRRQCCSRDACPTPWCPDARVSPGSVCGGNHWTVG